MRGIARGGHAHEARVERVLQVAAQDAVLDQHIALAHVALVVDVERAAPRRDGAVVEHGDARRRHALADAPAEGARALAVEVALEPVAHGLVQQDAGPAGAEHHAHLARGGRARVQVHERAVHGLVDVFGDQGVVENCEPEAPAAAGRAHFAPALLLGDHRDRQPHQRAHVGRERAVGARHQHHVVLARQARHDLYDARVLGACALLYFFEQGHLGRAVQRGDGVGGGVEVAARCYF